MKCQNCGYENPENNKFCGECGAELPRPIIFENVAVERIDSVDNDETVEGSKNPDPINQKNESTIEPEKPNGKILIFLAILALVIIFAPIAQKLIKYYSAENFLKQNDYKNAVDAYVSLGNFLDSENKLIESNYQWANAMYSQNNYSSTIYLLSPIGAYKDSLEILKKSKYLYSDKLLIDKKYEEVIELLSPMEDDDDAKSKINDAKYNLAKQLVTEEKFDRAIEIQQTIEDYSDTKLKLKETKFLYVKYLVSREEYEKAKALVDELGNYQNVGKYYPQIYYGLGVHAFKVGNFEDAKSLLLKTNGYSNAGDILTKNDFMNFLQGDWEYEDGHETVLFRFDGWKFYKYAVIDGSLSLLHGQANLTINSFKGENKILVEEKNEEAFVYFFISKIDDISIEIIDNRLFSQNQTERLNNSYVGIKPNMVYSIGSYIIPEPKADPAIGMTVEQVQKSSWGYPSSINKTTTAFGVTEQWVYDDNNGMKFLYFDNGILTTISE